MISKAFPITLSILSLVVPSFGSSSGLQICIKHESWPELDPTLDSLAGNSVKELYATAKEDARLACVRELLNGDAICTNPFLGLDWSEKLYNLAVVAVKCPKDIDASLTAQKWAKWWHTENPANPFDLRSDADKFLAYAVQRNSGKIVTTAKNANVEFILLRDYDSGRVSPETDEDSKEATQGTDLVQKIDVDSEAKADVLQAIASERRSALDKIAFDCSGSPRGGVIETLYHAAVTALKCPGRDDAEDVASRWSVAWDQTHATVSDDVRSVTDRFLDHVLKRAAGKLIANARELRLEAQLAQLYEVALKDFAKSVPNASSQPLATETAPSEKGNDSQDMPSTTAMLGVTSAVSDSASALGNVPLATGSDSLDSETSTELSLMGLLSDTLKDSTMRVAQSLDVTNEEMSMPEATKAPADGQDDGPSMAEPPAEAKSISDVSVSGADEASTEEPLPVEASEAQDM